MTHRRSMLKETLLVALVLGTVAAGAPALAAEDDVATLGKLCQEAAQAPDPTEGIQACTKLLEPGRTGIKPAAVYSNRGAGWSAAKRFDLAIEDFNNAIQRDPKNIPAYTNRGIARWSRGELEQAIADFGDAINLNPKFAFAYLARGTALTDKGEFDLAIRDFDKAIGIDPKMVAAYKGRGSARYRKGDLDRAAADFNQLVRLQPQNADSFNDRAQVFLARGDLDKALADYSDAIKLQPDYWRGYSSRGEAFRIKGDFDKALADHDEAIRLDPKSTDAYNNRGLTWMSKGDVDRAIADFGEAILLNPGYGYAYGNRGEAYRLKGDLTKSLADLDKAISLTAKSSLQLCRRGDTLRHGGDFDRALGDYAEALRMSPAAICAFTGKGLVAEAKGELAGARAEFERAAAVEAWRDPDPTTARQVQVLAQTRLAAVKTALAEQAKLAAQEAAKIAKANEPKEAVLPPIDPGRRVALVIGNSAYFNTEVLPNPRRDAESIADAFRRIGFQQVILQKDLTREKLTNTLQDFSRVAATADWAVIYYAGHGLEVEGKNYMIPIDAKLAVDTDVTFEGVALDQVMTSVNRAKKLRLVMLDACRDNPFAKSMTRSTGEATRNINRGLAAIEPDGATLVVYAAKAGQLALDGSGRGNSPFVSAFLRNLEKPRVEIRKLFDLVRDDVMEATSNRQQPFTYGSVPGREDYFMVTK